MSNLKTFWVSLILTLCCNSLLFAQSDKVDLYVDTARYSDGDEIPYVFVPSATLPSKYALIVMLGGHGTIGLKKNADGTPFFSGKGNFLARTRGIFSDGDVAVVVIDRGRSLDRMRGVIADLRAKFPAAKIYVADTSMSITETIYMAENMDGEVAGFIHTSSVGSNWRGLDTRNRKNRNLIVTHKYDGCKCITQTSSSIENSERYGTPLFVVEGGIDEGDPCQASGHHGYRGIEQEVVDKIKAWMKQS
ncbi:hypothetical protein [Polynucleobacter necessarius]|uniref:hypothetical protein n=1 Tax=Polynucleobacter necessarius TaxID=576610 RepID=UPI000E095383|nr:hypothetical protein [Polynucleobacter necessarius]